MATGIVFHAHPDDEAIGTGGTIAKAKSEGHRVVLVVATNGEEGTPVEGVLAHGEALGDRRVDETRRSAEILDVDRVVFLDYRDSGMMGEPANDHPASFWQAPVDDAAARLAAVLLEESADLIVVYDDNGVYGHPDHIQVHRVGVRAAELAGVTRVYEMSLSRDHMERTLDEFARLDPDFARERADRDPNEVLGLPEEQLTHQVDVADFVDRKRAALMAHASQISADHPMLKMPRDAFVRWLGFEWFRDRNWRRNGAAFRTDIFTDHE